MVAETTQTCGIVRGMIQNSDVTEREKRQREIQILKALARRGPKNRWQGFVLRALKNRHPGAADSIFPK
jgi:hypothetical protein